MTITTILRTTKYKERKKDANFEPIGEKEIPVIKEKVLCEFKVDSRVGSAILEMYNSKNSLPQFSKEGNLEFVQWMDSETRYIEENVVVVFSK